MTCIICLDNLNKKAISLTSTRQDGAEKRATFHAAVAICGVGFFFFFSLFFSGEEHVFFLSHHSWLSTLKGLFVSVAFARLPL